MSGETDQEDKERVTEEEPRQGEGEDVANPEGTEPWEAEVQRPAVSPKMPSAAEREAHELTHCPPRSWCDHCVKGQSKDDPHRLVKESAFGSSDVPRINMDYAYLKENTAVHCMKINTEIRKSQN